MNTHTENEAFIKQLMLLPLTMMMRKLIMNANGNDTKVLVSFVCICVCAQECVRVRVDCSSHCNMTMQTKNKAAQLGMCTSR